MGGWLIGFRVIGAALVPIDLLSFGMSMHGQRLLARGSPHRHVVLITTVLSLPAFLITTVLLA